MHPHEPSNSSSCPLPQSHTSPYQHRTSHRQSYNPTETPRQWSTLDWIVCVRVVWMLVLLWHSLKASELQKHSAKPVWADCDGSFRCWRTCDGSSLLWHFCSFDSAEQKCQITNSLLYRVQCRKEQNMQGWRRDVTHVNFSIKSYFSKYTTQKKRLQSEANMLEQK